jgi:hypothetical protein
MSADAGHGDHGGGGMGKAWGYTILAMVVIFSGVVLILTNQLGAFFTMLGDHYMIFFGAAGLAAIMKGLSGKKEEKKDGKGAEKPKEEPKKEEPKK